MGDLHSEHAEAYSIKEILKRVRAWLAGKIIKDSPEVKLFAHFLQRNEELQYLLPDLFFDTELAKGEYYAVNPIMMLDILPKTYIGTAIIGENASGVAIRPKWYRNEALILFARTPDIEKLVFERNTAVIDQEKKKGNLVQGYWWDITTEPNPFSTIEELSKYIGKEDENKGLEELLKALGDEVKRLEDKIHIGLRFPGRRRDKDWQMFVLRKGERIPLIMKGLEELRDRLLNYKIEAVYQEYLTEEYFHLRNTGRADRAILRKHSLSIIGCGALGSETADAMCKAGAGVQST